MANKYLDLVGLQAYHAGLKTNYLIDLIPTIVLTDTAASGDPADYKINAENLTGTTATDLILGNGVTATTQATDDNSTKVATTAYVKANLTGITEPMIFKGGTNVVVTGTTSSHTVVYKDTESTPAPLTNVKTGWTYKVISVTVPEGVTGDDIPKEGDTVIATVSGSTTEWTIVPSGDETGTFNTITIADNAPDSGTSAAITASGNGTTTATLTINPASASTFGVVKVGTNIGVTDGVISVASASADTLGLVKTAASSGLTNTDGAIAVNVDGTIVTKDSTDGTITVAKASTDDFGVVKVGDNITVGTGNDAGVISVAKAGNGTLGVASADPANGITSTNGDLAITSIPTSVMTRITSGAAGEDTNEIAALFA